MLARLAHGRLYYGWIIVLTLSITQLTCCGYPQICFASSGSLAEMSSQIHTAKLPPNPWINVDCYRSLWNTRRITIT